VIAAHGGGYFPTYLGRADHAHRVRPESRTTDRAPSAYLSNIYVDSVVYDPGQLRRLIEAVGPTHVLLGSDFPFDMADPRPLETLEAVPGLSAADRAAVAGGNALRLFTPGRPAALPSPHVPVPERESVSRSEVESA
jgi:aminocarboxymuconate-semialdehyde decarboxylase